MLKPTATIAARMDVLDDQQQHLLLHLHGRAPKRRALAVGVLTPNLQLDPVAFDHGHAAATAIGPAGDVDSSIADLERLQRAAIAEPIRNELAEEGGLQEPVQDHSREPHALRVGLVVMDLVKVALRARVLHELPRRRMLYELGQLLAGGEVHRLIAVPRSRATMRPCWFTYSVSKMMKSRLPLAPVFS